MIAGHGDSLESWQSFSAFFSTVKIISAVFLQKNYVSELIPFIGAGQKMTSVKHTPCLSGFDELHSSE